MRKRKIPLATLRISSKAKQYVLETLNANRLSYGPFTERFERMFAQAHKRKFAMVTNSGTSALHIALHTLKEHYAWDDNDEVLIPAITFIASSNIVLHNRMRPVFVDVERDYYCLDPQKIEEKISPKTRAILPVHLFGQSADMDPILEIAKKYNLKILEDSCETMFIKYKGNPVGSLGDIAAYSTYIAHIITTGVGGIVATNDKALAKLMKSLMFHGRDTIYLKIEDDDTYDETKLNSLIERRLQFTSIGYSYRLTEMEGALGLAEIERKDYIVKRRQRVGQSLDRALREFSDHFQLPKVRLGSEHVYMLFPIVIKNPKIDRNNLLRYLEESGIETRLFFPLLSQPVYKKILGDIEAKYPVAKQLVEKGFIIGSHATFTKADINYIYQVFRNYIRQLH